MQRLIPSAILWTQNHSLLRSPVMSTSRRMLKALAPPPTVYPGALLAAWISLRTRSATPQ